ncbi:hypothetical protein [uncultured Paraglaciecola sp.]|uniref:hypothetical protein n=1 Tax=uncultured Paraglaciecola sp. TaxID=1765024 RepID=UPI002631C6FB|nr:hypothetical protein [uncultured Paraglaciecola sp.]
MSAIINEAFSSVGATDGEKVQGHFNVEVVFSNTGSINLERMVEGGVEYIPVETITEDVSKIGHDPVYGNKYRFNCTAIDGTATVRITK